MTVPKINSAHGSDTRNLINRVIDVLNQQGKTIQDLVAEGQLTEGQYTELITVINGLIKSGHVDKSDLTPELRSEVDKVRNKIDRGEVSVYDINKNKGLLDETYFSDEVKQQWTGTTPVNATPPNRGVTTQKLANKAVTAKKTGFLLEKSSNLFNKLAITYGKYMSQTGAISDSVNYDLSEFIEVKPNTSYVFKHTSAYGAFYDGNQTFISSVNTATTTSPVDAAYFRMSILKTNIETQQMCEGTVLPSYEPYYVETDETIRVKNRNIPLKEFSIDKIDGIEKKIVSKNLFNSEGAIYGYYEYNGGTFVPSETEMTTGLIKVKPNTMYHKNTTSGWDITFFDEDNVFVVGMSSEGNYEFTVPNDPEIKFMRIKIASTTNISSYFVGEGPYQEGYYDAYEEGVVIDGIDLSKRLTGTSGSERYTRARGKVNLFIETYYEGGNQPYHPSVYSFDDKWNYYKYWMAYTPLPFGDEPNENPCIAVSDDMINWQTRPTQVNPIDDLSDGTQTYWSDTELVYNPTTDLLECWYRGYNATTKTVTICRKTTSDGASWGAREVLAVFENTSARVSPSVIFENGVYKIWLLRPNLYFETTDPFNWGTGISYSIGNAVDWHGQVKHTDKGYEYIISGEYGEGVIDYLISQDGINFEYKGTIIKSNKLLGLNYGIDAIGFYRPCFIKENGKYYVFYSTVAGNNSRGVTLSISNTDDITDLTGVDESAVPSMAKPTRRSMYGLENMIFDETDNTLNYCPKPSTTKQVPATWFTFNPIA